MSSFFFVVSRSLFLSLSFLSLIFLPHSSLSLSFSLFSLTSSITQTSGLPGLPSTGTEATRSIQSWTASVTWGTTWRKFWQRKNKKRLSFCCCYLVALPKKKKTSSLLLPAQSSRGSPLASPCPGRAGRSCPSSGCSPS